MPYVRTTLLFSGLLACSCLCWADNKIEIDKGYPKAGPGLREILVNGTCALDAGWSLVDNVVVVYLWRDGLEVTKVATKVRENKYSCRAVVAVSNEVGEHNVLVEMTIRKGK